MAPANRPFQFSLRTLFFLLVVTGAALATLRDLYLLIDTQGATPNWSFAPMVGWLALAAIYYRPGMGDLLFVHGLLPALALSIVGLSGLASAADLSDPSFWSEFLPFAYSLLYGACLAGAAIGLLYCLW